MNSRHINALRYWVTEESRNYRKNRNGDIIDKEKTVGERIQEIINYTDPLSKELIVYRGHKNTPNTINPKTWFSTTTSYKIAKNEYSDNECCTFKLFIQPGIIILDVHKLLKTKGIELNTYKDENEIIINGGGEFFKDFNKKELGFEYKNGMYQSYYFPKRTQLNSQRILNRIPKNEYEFITNVNDIKQVISKNEIVNNSTLQNVLKQIKNETNMGT